MVFRSTCIPIQSVTENISGANFEVSYDNVYNVCKSQYQLQQQQHKQQNRNYINIIFSFRIMTFWMVFFFVEGESGNITTIEAIHFVVCDYIFAWKKLYIKFIYI